MQKYALSQLTEETLNALVTLKEQAEISNDIEFAPVYNGVLQAERVVEILKFIVAKHVNVST